MKKNRRIISLLPISLVIGSVVSLNVGCSANGSGISPYIFNMENFQNNTNYNNLKQSNNY
jgi:hypothetical protein